MPERDESSIIKQVREFTNELEKKEYAVILPLARAIELEKHLKFNPWEEISENEREEVLKELGTKFSDQEILEKVIEPLVKSLILERDTGVEPVS